MQLTSKMSIIRSILSSLHAVAAAVFVDVDDVPDEEEQAQEEKSRKRPIEEGEEDGVSEDDGNLGDDDDDQSGVLGSPSPPQVIVVSPPVQSFSDGDEEGDHDDQDGALLADVQRGLFSAVTCAAISTTSLYVTCGCSRSRREALLLTRCACCPTDKHVYEVRASDANTLVTADTGAVWSLSQSAASSMIIATSVVSSLSEVSRLLASNDLAQRSSVFALLTIVLHAWTDEQLSLMESKLLRESKLPHTRGAVAGSAAAAAAAGVGGGFVGGPDPTEQHSVLVSQWPIIAADRWDAAPVGGGGANAFDAERSKCATQHFPLTIAASSFASLNLNDLAPQGHGEQYVSLINVIEGMDRFNPVRIVREARMHPFLICCIFSPLHELSYLVVSYEKNANGETVVCVTRHGHAQAVVFFIAQSIAH